MSHIQQDRCLEHLRNGVIPTGDSDISGTGVVLAFILSAYISFGVVLVAYVSGFVDDDLLSAVDRRVFRIRPSGQRHPRIQVPMEKAILALGDQQIVTGIAILGAGFYGLQTGQISVYHYQIVLYLAWMSSSVHLSALTILGSLLKRSLGLMLWRVTGMLVLLVLLIVALIPTISNDWGLQRWDGMLPGRSGWGIPARCFWGRLWGDGINSDSVIGFVILGVSYIWKVGALFPSTATWYNRLVRHPLEHLAIRLLGWAARRYANCPTWYWLLSFRLTLTATLPVFAAQAMLASFAASLWLSALGLVFGTMQVVIPRNQNLWYTASQETRWSFGQLVPLILLVQPLGAVSEHVWPAEGSIHHHSKEDDTEDGRFQSAVTDDHQLRNQTLLEWFGAHAGLPTSHQRRLLEAALYESKLFGFVVVLINCAILATAVVVYVVDAESVGNWKAPKWELTAQCIGFCVAGIVAIVFMLTPVSRLGQPGSSRTQSAARTGTRTSRDEQRLNGKALALRWSIARWKP